MTGFASQNAYIKISWCTHMSEGQTFSLSSYGFACSRVELPFATVNSDLLL